MRVDRREALVDESHRNGGDTRRQRRSIRACPGRGRSFVTGKRAREPHDHPDRAVLGRLVVRQADVGATRTVLLIPNGNVTTQPTLDLCNGTFPSERLRTGRLQVAVVDQAGTTLLSTEAVLYRNPAASAQGFAELRKVRAACPNSAVKSPVASNWRA